AVSPGEYRFVIEAKNAAGKKLGVTTDFSGKISGVNFTKDGAILLIGNKSVKLSDVKKIVDVDPQVDQQNGQKMAVNKNLDLRDSTRKLDNDKIEKAPAATPVGNMDSVAMAGEVLNKLEKE